MSKFIPVFGLKELLGFRKRLVRENAGYTSSIKERLHMYEVNAKGYFIKTYNKKLNANLKEIEYTEKLISELIHNEEAESKPYFQ